MRTYVQLGILQDIFDWIFSNILAPVFKVVGEIVGAIFTVLFENFLLPLLELRLTLSLQIVRALLENFIYNLLFQVSRLLMWVLNAIERIFRTLAGLLPVYITDDNGKIVESGSLLLTLLRNKTITTALLGMITASVAFCFLIAIFATIRAAGDMSGKHPVGEVLRQTARSLLQLILIPFMALALVVLGDAVLQSIEIATGHNHIPVSDILFTMSTLDAVREDTYGDAVYYNVSTRSMAMSSKNAPDKSSVADFGLQDKYRKPFYTGEKDRDNIIVVLETFDIRRMDYIISVGLTIVFIFLFGIMSINMASRIFDCLLLLLVEPFFAAAIPLDEGEKFEKWKDLFLGRLISGYGMIVAMNLYLSVINLIFSGKIRFFGPKTTPAVEYLVEILFVAVGAFTMLKAGPVVTGIMSAQAGAREAEVQSSSQQAVTNVVSTLTAPVRRIAGEAISNGWQNIKSAISRATDGSVGGSSGGGVATAGTGAFGQGSASGPTGVHFSGVRTAGGQTVSASGSAGARAGGPGPGVHFNSRMSALGSARGNMTGFRRSGAGGAGGAAAPVAGSLGGAAAPAAGAGGFGAGGFEDDFDTIFDVGGVSLFDEGGAGDGGEDDFDTVFDVGGRSLFDEGDSGPSDAFKGRGTSKQTVRKPPGGLAAPFRSGVPGAASASFLQAGDAPGPVGSETYTWVGQRDAEEREDKKKLEEQQKAEQDAAALSAAESATGMDLNGDGVLSGAGELNMYEAEKAAGMDLDGDGFIGGSINDPDEDLFGGDALSNEKLFGGDALSNEKLFGGDTLSDEKLFGAPDPFTGRQNPDADILKAAESNIGLDLDGDGFIGGSINDPDEDLFGGDALSNEKLFGGDAISNEKLCGGDAISDESIFSGEAAADPFGGAPVPPADDFVAGSINDPDE
ncbi:MAG: hypothetical protein II800_03145 [Lachnospiraceae bacterium]|nr:hypothetical protein [Lachnospiraceae bacterium]